MQDLLKFTYYKTLQIFLFAQLICIKIDDDQAPQSKVYSLKTQTHGTTAVNKQPDVSREGKCKRLSIPTIQKIGCVFNTVSQRPGPGPAIS